MKKIFLLVAMLGVLRSTPVVAQSQQKPGDFAQTAEGQVLAKVIGVWRREMATNDATELSADRQINRWSLKSRWLEGHRRSPDGSETAVVMSTYDTERQTYIAYLFSPAGTTARYLGKFDADLQQMNWIDRNAKTTTSSLERLTDPDTLDIKGSVQDSEGKAVKQWSLRFTRMHDSEMIAGSPKQQAPSKFQETDEGKVLSRYIGQWHSNLVFMGREKPIDYDTSWALQGRWLYAKVSSSDGKEGLTLTTYDAAQKAYATWSFSSDGTLDSWKGTWDADAWRMTWGRRSTSGGVTDVDQFIDDNTIEIRSMNQDSAGRTLFEANEHVKRK